MASAATVGAGLATAGAAHAESPYNVWDRVATCESTNNWTIDTGNGYYGGLQISPRTWRAFGGRKFARTPHKATKREQVRVAKRIKRHQGWGAWPHCSRRIGVRR